MRLATQKKIIDSNRPYLAIAVEAIKDVKGEVRITKNPNFTDAIRALSEVPLLSGLAANVMKHSIFSLSNSAVVSGDLYNEFTKLLSPLAESAASHFLLLSSAAPQRDAALAAVKLPNIQTLEELEQFIKALKTIFDLPARTLLDGGVAFAGFDTGSAWLLLDPETAQTVATAAVAVGVTAGAVKTLTNTGKKVSDFIFDFLAQYQTYRIDRAKVDHIERQLEELKGASEIREKLREQQATVISAQLEERARHLLELHRTDADAAKINETVAQVKNAMRELDKLVMRGTEIHPSLSAPADKVERMHGAITGIIPPILSLPASSEPSSAKGKGSDQKPKSGSGT